MRKYFYKPKKSFHFHSKIYCYTILMSINLNFNLILFSVYYLNYFIPCYLKFKN